MSVNFCFSAYRYMHEYVWSRLYDVEITMEFNCHIFLARISWRVDLTKHLFFKNFRQNSKFIFWAQTAVSRREKSGVISEIYSHSFLARISWKQHCYYRNYKIVDSQLSFWDINKGLRYKFSLNRFSFFHQSKKSIY